MGKERHRQTRSESSCLRCRGESLALRDESASKANCFEFFVHATIGVPRRPAGGILKKTDAADLSVGTKVEPVQRPARNANQVARLHFDSNNRRCLGIHMEKPAPLDDEANLVLLMPMFPAELRKHGVQVWGLCIHVNHI